MKLIGNVIGGILAAAVFLGVILILDDIIKYGF